jgi:hypothetical protein
VNLYRIMTDILAGSHQRSVTKGDRGIVNLWVRAESQDIALAQADGLHEVWLGAPGQMLVRQQKFA